MQFSRAALLGAALALLVIPPAVRAASCCGGGSAASLILPKDGAAMMDVSMSREHYDGLWRKDGTWVPDPPDSDLNQYRLNLGLGRRLGDNWQASIGLPYVWNRNRYSGLDSNTAGLGDSTVSLWYEAFDSPMCVYAITTPADLMPAIYWGATLTLPTGVSPYDKVQDNFDITGRGFYRLDANVLVDKTVYPWTASLQASYGRYRQRPVNREFGTYVEPYDKQLGDRFVWSLSGGYIYFTDALQEITTTLAYGDLQEGKTTIDGHTDPTSGMRKRSLTLSVAWATPAKDWVVKGSWNHTRKRNDWGENFPSTDIITLGVSHVWW
jgi:hypothetical protein